MKGDNIKLSGKVVEDIIFKIIYSKPMPKTIHSYLFSVNLNSRLKIGLKNHNPQSNVAIEVVKSKVLKSFHIKLHCFSEICMHSR